MNIWFQYTETIRDLVRSRICHSASLSSCLSSSCQSTVLGEYAGQPRFLMSLPLRQHSSSISKSRDPLEASILNHMADFPFSTPALAGVSDGSYFSSRHNYASLRIRVFISFRFSPCKVFRFLLFPETRQNV